MRKQAKPMPGLKVAKPKKPTIRAKAKKPAPYKVKP